VNAGIVVKALAAKYTAPEYAFLTEVRNSVGFQKKIRTADAMAMSLWPSRGLYMTGFEVKVSRADWKKELESPEKAEELARFCKLWFVACPDKMIDKDEVPPGWGLIYVREDGSLKYQKPAPEQPTTEEPTWILFASLMRDVVDNWTPKSLTDERLRVAIDEAKKNWENSQRYDRSRAEEKLATIRKNVAAFESASGIKIDQYSEYFNGEIGKAVALVRCWQGTPPDQLSVMQSSIERLGREVGEVINSIGKVRVTENQLTGGAP